MKIERALISVSDKSQITELADELHKLNIEIISTGGTADLLRQAGLSVKGVSEITGFPEIMDGRVKTLHPLIHGGILACRDNPEHMQTVKQENIPLIDLVIVNLYPFQEVTAKHDCSLDLAIENIDIGGPAMLRASAKNHKHVVVVTDPTDYQTVLEQIKATGGVDRQTRAKLAVKVFQHTARYDAAVDSYLSLAINEENRLHLDFTEGRTLRYGENSHQQALFYRDPQDQECSAANSEQLNGKPMSYNNYVDANAALEVIKDLSQNKPAVSIIKHTNPCGLATGKTAALALEKAWDGDPISSFGGVIATNTTVDLDFAEFLKGENIQHIAYTVINGEYIPTEAPGGKFVEVIIAPAYTAKALEFLKRKSKLIRLLKYSPQSTTPDKTFRAVTGGILVQDKDAQLTEKFDVVTEKQFPKGYQALSEFTLTACKHTKSNAIILGREYEPGEFQVMGMGAGQPNRVDSMRKLAIPKAQENLKREFEKLKLKGNFEEWWQEQIQQMVLVSDGFFPFDDTVREAVSFGVRYIIQPGGSMRDKDSIKACNELNTAMAFTGLRHFNH